MAIDQATYELEGFKEQIATHSVRIKDLREKSDGTVEVDFGVMWEPDRDGANETGTPQYLSPIGAIYVNGSEVGTTPELSARSSFHTETTVQIPEASAGDSLRFVFPQNDGVTVYTEAVVQADVPAAFDPDAVDVACNLSTLEVPRGAEMTFLAVVTNNNEQDASVSVEWDVDGLRFGVDDETVPANVTSEISLKRAVDLPPGGYEPSMSVDVREK